LELVTIYIIYIIVEEKGKIFKLKVLKSHKKYIVLIIILVSLVIFP